jgi:peptide/nickel transport system permease protein
VTTTVGQLATNTPNEVAEVAKPRRYHVNARLVGGGIGVAALIAASFIGPHLISYGPLAQQLTRTLEGPSASHLLGTDFLGRDLLSRLLYGLRPSFVAGLGAVAFASCVGTILGLVAGAFGGVADVVIGRFTELIISWPSIFLALALVLVLGTGEPQVVLAIGVAQVPVFTRLVRSITLTNMSRQHVQAARSMGASTVRIIRRHIVPFAVAPLVVQFALSAPDAVTMEAALNYLGLGTQPPNPSLGAILSDAQNYIYQSIWGVIFPIVVIALLVLSLTFTADGVQEMVDPREVRSA